jgi:hypothetical protein
MLDNSIWWEKFYQRTHPAWREKVIMTHVLIVYPTLEIVFWSMLTMRFRQPSHEFTFGVGMSFILYPMVLTPLV